MLGRGDLIERELDAIEEVHQCLRGLHPESCATVLGYVAAMHGVDPALYPKSKQPIQGPQLPTWRQHEEARHPDDR